VLNVKRLFLDRVRDLLADIKSKTNPADLPVNYEADFIGMLPEDGAAKAEDLPAG